MEHTQFVGLNIHKERIAAALERWNITARLRQAAGVAVFDMAAERRRPAGVDGGENPRIDGALPAEAA
jgi:hypothetical protein